ncbi:unnamed protein product [Macrosiphum euphorbiae]|nr:unnamed protein product [Macrosiphum euphorbiae]
MINFLQVNLNGCWAAQQLLDMRIMDEPQNGNSRAAGSRRGGYRYEYSKTTGFCRSAKMTLKSYSLVIKLTNYYYKLTIFCRY